MKILIVDDDKILAEVLQCLFENEGWEAEAKFDGENLEEKIGEKMPTAIILDYKLPGASGIEVLQKLRKKYTSKGLPVMMISASKQIEKVALEAGANAFMAKPFDIAKLLAMVQNLIP